MKRIMILTGPIRSGKTTRLAEWESDRWNVGGLLSPDGPRGRFFLDLTTGDTQAMEHPGVGEEAIIVGRFQFRAAAFEWANARLSIAAGCGWAVIAIDEIGPLELRGGGLRPGLEAALRQRPSDVLLVVREHLVGDVVREFGLDHAEVVSEIGW